MVFPFYIPQLAYSTGDNWGQIMSNEKNDVVSLLCEIAALRSQLHKIFIVLTLKKKRGLAPFLL